MVSLSDNLSVSGHWREAKWRIGYVAFSLFLTFCVCFHFGDCLLYLFSTPLGSLSGLEVKSSLPLSTLLDNPAAEPPPLAAEPPKGGGYATKGESNLDKGLEQVHFIYTEVTEAFLTYLLLSLSFSCYFAFPLVSYHLYSFVKPGLFRYEADFFALFLCVSCTLFLLANLWTYFYFLPMMFDFFLGFGSGVSSGGSVSSQGGTGLASTLVDLQLSARILPFVSFVLGVGWQMGLCFQFPLYFFLLLRFGLLPLGAFARPLGRKVFFVLALVVAALLTPPDVFSQLFLVSCIQFFFELSLFLVFLAVSYG
jgi:Tat protein translocase TatC